MIVQWFVALLVCSVPAAWANEEKSMRYGEIIAKVLGNSGKISIKHNDYDEDIVVDMVEIIEVNTNSSADKGVGKGNEHAVKSFASQNFTFSDSKVDGKYGDLDVTQFKFTSNMKNNATLSVWLYMFKKEGQIDNGGEKTQVKTGTVKFNIELKDWRFCENVSSDCNETGDAVDFTISIKSKDKPKKESGSSEQAENYDLGNGNIQLSRKVKIGSTFKTMANDYPKLEENNTKQLFTFRFPKYDGIIMYDPAIDINASAVNTANMLTLLLAALSLAFTRLVV